MIFYQNIKKTLFIIILTLNLASCSKDESVENVFQAINILSSLGNFVPQQALQLTDSEERYYRNSYCQAYSLGSDYKINTLRKKLGNEFGNKWAKTVPSLEIICTHWEAAKDLKPGYKFKQDHLNRVFGAMQNLENFRLFYVRWRNS